MPKDHMQPRNAYEEAALLFKKIRESAARVEGGDKLVKNFDELWRLFELCIPDSDKPGKEN